MDFRPALRADIRVRFTEGGCELHDPVLDRHLELGRNETRVVRLLDGHTAAEIAAAAPSGERTLRHLLLLHLLDGAGAASVERVRRLKAGELQAQLWLLDGARFQCQGSGECCQNYVFGPLEDDDVARLAALDGEIRAAFPELGAAPLVEQKERHGARRPYLRTVEDRCVFLQPDRRCGLHGKFGADSKPQLCRLYPFEVLPTLDGVRVFDKGSCASFAVSARRGLPLADDVARFAGLLPARYSLYHPAVQLAPAVFCDYATFLVFNERALEQASGGSSAAHALGAIGATLRALGAALAGCAIAPGEPARTVAAVLASAPEPLASAPAAAAAARSDAGSTAAGGALARVAGDLAGAVASMIAGAVGDERSYFSARLLREAAQLLHALQQLASGAPDDYHRTIAAVPLDDPEIDVLLRISLRQQLFGRNALVDDEDAPSALLRMALILLLAALGARIRAVVEARAATAQDLSWGHMLAVRLLSMSAAREVLLFHQDAAWPVLAALPALLAPGGSAR